MGYDSMFGTQTLSAFQMLTVERLLHKSLSLDSKNYLSHCETPKNDEIKIYFAKSDKIIF